MKYKTGETILAGDDATSDYGHDHIQIRYLVDTKSKKMVYGMKNFGAFVYVTEMGMEMFYGQDILESEETDFIKRGNAPDSDVAMSDDQISEAIKNYREYLRSESKAKRGKD